MYTRIQNYTGQFYTFPRQQYSFFFIRKIKKKAQIALLLFCGFRRNKELIKQLSKPANGAKDVHFPSQYSQPFLTQCKACLWKQHLSYWRNPTYTALRILFTTLTALMFGTMFWGLGTKRYENKLSNFFFFNDLLSET